MTSVFPQFASLDMSDILTLKTLTNSFPPYSDFNFTSLWSWDVQNQVKYSVLNQNLVVCFTDYVSGKPCLSFIGNHATHETAVTLLAYLQTSEQTPEIKLVPEICVPGLRDNELSIELDPDNFDYILAIDRLIDYAGSQLKPHRNLVTKFSKQHQSSIRFLDLSSATVQRNLIDFFELWIINKRLDYVEAENEFRAFQRLFQLASHSALIGIGLYVNDALAGFTINELLPNGFVMIHFEKADPGAFPGAYQVLMQETAKIFKQRGYLFINYQQDLGLPGLKKNKQSFDPHHYLHKYRLRLKTPATN